MLVWAIARLMAVFVGLPMLLTIEGVHVDVGLIVNALAGIGAFSAAAAAVWIATKDRRQRSEERDAAERPKPPL